MRMVTTLFWHITRSTSTSVTGKWQVLRLLHTRRVRAGSPAVAHGTDACRARWIRGALTRKPCACSGDKNIITFGGDHNSPRPAFFFDSVGIFFHNVLIENAELEAAEPMSPQIAAAQEYNQQQYSSAYAGSAPDLSARNRQSPPKDHHQPPPNAWGDSHALSAAFAPLSGGRGDGEEGVIDALRTSLREMEMELGPDDPNVQEIRKMLREYESQGH
jgi:hypothetical protein